MGIVLQESLALIAAGYVLAGKIIYFFVVHCSHRPCCSKPKTLADELTNQRVTLYWRLRSADTPDSIFHFDFYRIENLEEAYDLGYEDYLYSGSYCFIEWPEMIESLLPDNIIEVKIETQEDESRIITANAI